MAVSAQVLELRQRQLRVGQDESMRTRLHRALSWLGRTEQEKDDDDARFLFLWVAFNAAYAGQFNDEGKELAKARVFIDRLLALDTQRRIHALLFERFSGPVRSLLDNRYVYAPFWRALANHDGSGRWKQSFDEGKRAALRALLDQATDVCLMLVLERLYVLRNQLVHGGATWRSSANRSQLRDGVRLLGTLVPLMLELMMEAGNEQQQGFGPVAYPWLPDLQRERR